MNYLIDVQAKEVPCLKVTFPIMSACKKINPNLNVDQLVSSILKFGLIFLCADMTRDS